MSHCIRGEGAVAHTVPRGEYGSLRRSSGEVLNCGFDNMTGLIDTQNQAWANDKSKFGYKMLQKMGWKEGKGLGLKENGMTEHLRFKKKTSAGGLGTSAASIDAWKGPAKVASGLNDVLSKLAPVSSGEVVKDPKERENVGGGKKKARGYYERRIAQKNVSRYSESDLKEIFGGVATENESAGQKDALISANLSGGPDAVEDTDPNATVGTASEEERDNSEREERRRRRKERKERKAAKKLGASVKIKKEKRTKKGKDGAKKR